MRYLTENPDIMLEVLAVLLRRGGGQVTLTPDEDPGPFNILSKWEPDGRLHLVLDESEGALERVSI